MFIKGKLLFGNAKIFSEAAVFSDLVRTTGTPLPVWTAFSKVMVSFALVRQ